MFVLPEHQGKGDGKVVIDAVMTHPDLQGAASFRPGHQRCTWSLGGPGLHAAAVSAVADGTLSPRSLHALAAVGGLRSAHRHGAASGQTCGARCALSGEHCNLDTAQCRPGIGSAHCRQRRCAAAAGQVAILQRVDGFPLPARRMRYLPGRQQHRRAVLERELPPPDHACVEMALSPVREGIAVLATACVRCESASLHLGMLAVEWALRSATVVAGVHG